MQNVQDAKLIMQYIQAIRSNNAESLDSINSINMLMVDNSNGRVKDERVGRSIRRLGEKLDEISDTIREVENLLKER